MIELLSFLFELGDFHQEVLDLLLLRLDGLIKSHKHGLLHLHLHRWFLVVCSLNLLFNLLLNNLNLCGVSNEKLDHLLKVKLTVAVFVNLLEFLLELSLHLLGDGATLGAVSEVLFE